MTKLPRASLNLALAAGFVASAFAQSIALPLWLIPVDGRWAWSLVPIALSTTSLWALLHEAIHGNFDRRRSVNDAAGRMLALCYGTTFPLIRPLHLLHHRVSRTEAERPDVLMGPGAGLAQRATYYFNLLGGLYLQQFLLPFLALYPKPVLAWLSSLAFKRGSFQDLYVRELLRDDGERTRSRIDTAALYLWNVAALWLYGRHAWALALFFAARAILASFLDYAYHYQAPLGDPRHGFDLDLPRWGSKAILHFNYHGTHHRHPSTPWHALPSIAGQKAPDGRLASRALRQLAGPRRSLLEHDAEVRHPAVGEHP